MGGGDSNGGGWAGGGTGGALSYGIDPANISGARGGGFLGMGGGGGDMWGSQGDRTVTPYNTTSPEQQAMQKTYADLFNKNAGSSRQGLQSLMGEGQYTISPSSQVNPWATQQFFNNNVYQPAMEQWTNATLPGIREGMGNNYWSTARRQQEQNAAATRDKGLSQQLANMQYQDEQARRGIADVTQTRQIQENAREQAQRINLLQLLDPLYNQNFTPVSTAHTVDQLVDNGQYQPGLMDRIGQVTGIAGGLLGAAGNVKYLASRR